MKKDEICGRDMKKVLLFAMVLCLAMSAVAQGRKGKIEITGDVRVSELVKKHIEFNERMQTVPGYRIQIAALSGPNSRNQAFELKRKFKEDFPGVEVYIVFTEPNFRIKVGDFTSKLDAYVYMQTIKERYPGTIVRENVYPIHPDMSDLIPETDEDADM
ncbi:MAG: SPOR domain-containing protein [Bacteroidales bacterium]|nr:SPOR domain-containing protein [Bacteroidales bacterium]